MKIKEFHCIMPIANVPSVTKSGVLSYQGAYVVNATAKRSVVETGFARPVTIEPDMFFC